MNESLDQEEVNMSAKNYKIIDSVEKLEEAIRLPYSETAYQEDMTWLRMKAREMCSESETDYPCRENLRACRFCDYETYCFPKKADPDTGSDLPEDDEPDDEIQPCIPSWKLS